MPKQWHWRSEVYWECSAKSDRVCKQEAEHRLGAIEKLWGPVFLVSSQ